MTKELHQSRDCYKRINCFTFLSGRQVISKSHLIAAGTFSLALVPIVGLANVFLLSHLRRKQNIPTTFRRLLQILCIADVLVGALALPSYAITLISYPHSCRCRVELVAQFMAALFGGASGRTTVIIAFHQSMNIKSFAVSSFMHTKRYKFMIRGLGFVVSSLLAVAVTVASKYRLYSHVAGAFTVLDIVFLAAVIFLYLSTYHSVRKHISTSELRRSCKPKYDRRFAKKVTRIITVLVICYGPFIMTNFVECFFVKVHPIAWLKLANIWSYNIVFANSFLNAMVFLCNDGILTRTFRRDNRVIALKITPVRSGSGLPRSNENICMRRLNVNELNLRIITNSSRRLLP